MDLGHRHPSESYDDYRSDVGRATFSSGHGGAGSLGGGGAGGGGQGHDYASSAFHDPIQPIHHGLHPWEEASLDEPTSARSHAYPLSKREYQHDDSSEEESPKRPKSGKSKASKDKDDGRPEGQRRAAQACLRCRKQKLRCTGGWPCSRCEKAKQDCDFGKAGPNPYGAAGGNREAQEATARLEQLESSVANLLAGLAGGAAPGGAYPNPNGAGPSGGAGEGSGYQGYEPHHGRASFGSASAADHTGRRPILPPPNAWAPPIPPPTHIRPIDPPRFPPISTDETAHVRFTNSPTINLINPSSISPSNVTSSGISPGSAILKEGERRERRLGKGEKAEERLAAAEGQGPFDPPFKALVYHPSVWENREQSRRSSPQPSGPASRDELHFEPYDRRFGREKDDPINVGLVDMHMAETLFNFFITHCHPFLPVVNVAIEDAFTTIRKSPPLISAMLAIAARFYNKFTARTPSMAQQSLPVGTPLRLANLAEMHLAQTLFRKQHALSDVQTILLLAAWGLQSRGKGPDAWIVTGHAARVARRLEVHKVLQRAAETARAAQPGTEEWAKLETFMPQWRTWLCWFCFDGFLSLGFGRPQSTQFETVDEQGFLQIRLNQSIPRPGSTQALSLYGDVYIAGQVQLTQIGRDLINWGELLADPSKLAEDDPRKADLSLTTMFKELNARLDEWCRLWVWAGSPYTLYLGSSARIARLQAEHMRLCLNSYALKSDPDRDETIAGCLKKALNAAMSTIQTHYEASQTDLALSFATDYLTITLAQAAVFLIRITKAPQPVQAVVKLEPSVIAHYLKMSVDLLESADLSETHLSIYLAKTIREISKAGGISIPGLGPAPSFDGASAPPTRPSSRAGTHLSPGNDISSAAEGANMAYADGGMAGGIGGGGASDQVSPPFDWETFLQTENQLDLGALLGLPGDDQSMIPGVNHGAVFGQGAGFEFGNSAGLEFGWGAIGNGIE